MPKITGKRTRTLINSRPVTVQGTKPSSKNKKAMPVGTLVPWAGGARYSAEKVGEELEGVPFVAVPFAGGMPELVHIKASTILVNDLHRHVINLARTLAHPVLGPRTIRYLRRQAFHPETFKRAQSLAQTLKIGESEGDAATVAAAYFISQWMGRNGLSGGPREFKSGLALRYTGAGGDSALRYSNAVKGLREWRKILARCSFTCEDWRKVIAKVKDIPTTAIYADPPWPILGDKLYSHTFTEEDHRELAETLNGYERSRIVVRYLDCPLSRSLYPEDRGWRWRCFTNRNTGNNEVAEVLIVKNGK